MTYIDDRGEIMPSDHEEAIVVNVGYNVVQIEKVFGPLIFATLRIVADPVTCEWVVRRAHDPYDAEGNVMETEWREVARIEGQPEGSNEHP